MRNHVRITGSSSSPAPERFLTWRNYPITPASIKASPRPPEQHHSLERYKVCRLELTPRALARSFAPSVPTLLPARVVAVDRTNPWPWHVHVCNRTQNKPIQPDTGNNHNITTVHVPNTRTQRHNVQLCDPLVQTPHAPHHARVHTPITGSSSSISARVLLDLA